MSLSLPPRPSPSPPSSGGVPSPSPVGPPLPSPSSASGPPPPLSPAGPPDDPLSVRQSLAIITPYNFNGATVTVAQARWEGRGPPGWPKSAPPPPTYFNTLISAM